MRNSQSVRGISSKERTHRPTSTAVALAAAAGIAGLFGQTSSVQAAYYVGWGGGSGDSWFNAANWPGTQVPQYNYDIPYFSNTNGNYTTVIDQNYSLCEGLYIGNGTPGLANNWIIAATEGNALNLQMFSITVNDGGYGAGEVWVNEQGHGSDVISAPINYNYPGINTGFTVDQSNVTNTFVLSGLITGGDGVSNFLPMTVQGAGSTQLSGGTLGVSTLTMNSTGTLTLTGSNNFAGMGMVVNSGNVVLDVTGAGNNAVGAAGLTINSGTTVQLGIGGNGNEIANTAPVVIASGATFDTNGQNQTIGTLTMGGSGVSGAGALLHSGTGSSTLIASSTTLTADTTIGVTNASATLTLNGNVGGNFGIIKAGAGTLVLAGSNTYSGNTNVSAGTLSVSGTLLSSGVVNVGSGTTLAGTGSVGSVNVSGGAIHPGLSAADGSIGTLTMASLTDTSSDLRFDVGGASSDVITDSGTATFSGATLSVALDSPPTASSYTILTAAGGITGSPTLTTTSIGRTEFTLSTVGDSLVLGVTGGPATLIWGKIGGNGDGTTWDSVQSNQNWNNNGSPDTFYNFDSVTFNDNNNGHTSVTMVGQVAPSSVTFANNASNYTLGGSGGITGATGVVLNGAGSVTLSSSNTYTGDTTINAGTLILAGGGSIADTNINVNGGALNFSGGTISAGTNVIDNATVNLTSGAAISGGLSGTGVVNLNGNTLTLGVTGVVSTTLQDGSSSGSINVAAGIAILVASNTYSGTTTTQSGATLQVGNGGTAGSLNPASSIVNQGNLIYNLSSNLTLTNPISTAGTVSFNGSGNTNVTSTITGAGTLQQAGTGTTMLSGNLSEFTGGFNVGGGVLQFNYSSPMIFSGPVNGTGAGTISNVGKLTFSGNQSFGAQVVTYDVASVAGVLADGVAADVELTGSLSRPGGDGLALEKTGPGTLAISGSSDDPSLGAIVNQGTLLLNKTSSSTAHAIGGGGLVINSGASAVITGTGGQQFYNGSAVLTINDGGLFDMNGQSDQVFGLTLGSTTTGTGGTLANNVSGTASVLIVGTAANGANAAAGVWQLQGNANVYVAAGSSLEIQSNGVGATPGATNILTTTGPGTVLLTGSTDDTSIGANVASGTLVLAKASTANAHAISSIYSVSPGATLQLGSSGTGGDQIYDGYVTASNPVDWGVLNMDGTFDMNGQSEGIDKLTGTGNVINSQTSNSALTLGTANLEGPTAPLFAGSISGNITLNLNVSGGTTTPYVLTGSNSYTGGTSISNGILQVGNATPTGSLGSGPVMINTNMALVLDRSDAALVIPGHISGGGNLFVIGTGTVTLGAANTYTGQTIVESGTLQLGVAGALPFATPGFNGTDLTISGGASVVAVHLATPAAIQLDSLNNSGLLDLNNNALDVNVGSASLSSIVAQVQSGYNNGNWNGSSGIISTDAATNPKHLTTLGVIVNDDGSGTPLYGAGGTIAATFEGVTPADGDVLVAYTYYGDANLDGKVDASDYSRIDNSYLAEQTGGNPVSGWYNGDFNYDGVVNGSDYTLIDNAFNTQGAQLDGQFASPTTQLGTSAVPEPTTLSILALGAAGLLGRRRRSI